ncbi:signal recognition particle-docking protein FtsY [Paramuribaculum intestinale]|uniref:signal recognition particle-docking protein FtsY n=1 Tax=Paramuribaculum intestinale TaxID=2094151 RepID=UPI0025A9A4EF|nr:signal recognition particle-docking protein FtsY [Paramuribaculum intestinale]
MGFFDLFSKNNKKETLDKGLERTKQGVFSKIARAIAGKRNIDDDFLDELEEIFVTSDVGVDTTLRIIERLQARVKRDGYVGTSELNRLLCEEIEALLADKPDNASSDDFRLPASGFRPYVIMVVGVNGAGKTTTIGKLAAQYKAAGYNVMLGAADTFRAAAVEQLEEWAKRAEVPIVKQKIGADPASVAYDTLQSAKARGDIDVVIIDTAGRLHNKKALMDELTKIRNVMRKIVDTAPDEVLLVLDGSTGQNAYEQARRFAEATDVTGLVVTKLDGTAKGGVVIGISESMQIPVRYIGLGEGIADLQVFHKKEFVQSLFGSK